MSNRVKIILTCIIATILIVVLWLHIRTNYTQSSRVITSHVEQIEHVENDPPLQVPGDEILAEYGSESLTARDDIKMIRHTIQNFRLLNNQIDARFFATNEDICELLRGKEGLSHQFLSNDSRIISPDGKLIDRWGVPLFFHLQAADHLDVRSAGPDGEMFTDDDISTATPDR